MPRVMILEDDPSVAELYAVTLRGTNLDVVVCSSLTEARTELRRELPDFLVTDVRLGEYNGLQLAILFRSMSPDGRILVVSGHGDVVIKQEAEKIGARFLVKPVDLDEFRNYLKV